MSNRLSTWIYATRPHTLGASAAPMLIVLGALITEGRLEVAPFVCAFVVALAAQISSNFANDYFDYKGEKDTDKRVGFRRVLLTGEVKPGEMRIALLISCAITIIAGILAILLTGAWWLLAVGATVLIGLFAYSYGPYPLSTHGWGDLAVVLFFGLTPILATYGAIGGRPPLYLLLLALGIGIWEDNILVSNNYRDYAEDRESGKRTLIVRMGEAFGPKMYLINTILTALLMPLGIGIGTGSLWRGLLLLALIVLAGLLLNRRIRKWKGSRLNQLLKETNIVTLLLGVASFILLIV